MTLAYMVLARVRKGNELKRRSLSDENSLSGLSDISPKIAYDNLVAHSDSVFRSSVEFKEKPRQILFGGILLACLAYVASRNKSNLDNPETVICGTLLGLLATIVVYCMLQIKDGLMVCCL
jgi:hypothetical protein